MNKKSFVLYTDIYDSIKTLSKFQKGELLDAIFIYASKHEEVLLKPETKMAFSFIKRSIDRESKKWEEIREKRRIAGSIGGKQKVANASISKHELANLAVPVPVNVINKLASLLGDSFKVEKNICYRKTKSGWEKINSPLAYLKKIEFENASAETAPKNIDGKTFVYPIGKEFQK